MDQFRRLLQALSLRQKISIAGAALAVLAGLFLFLNWNKERQFQLLYSDLSAEDASAVIARLKEAGIDYRLEKDGAVIKVPQDNVAELRLQMAAAGIPKSGRIGFELFDKVHFGTTEFAEQINYHRALEGELERSVMALSEIESARVHLTKPQDSVFLDNRRPAKASVLVKLKPGASLSPQNVQAIAHLMASAVEGLGPEMVSILDVAGNLLNRPRPSLNPEDGAPSEAMLDYRRGIERDLLAKVHNTLEPLLGADKYRAGIFVECDFTSGEQSEENFNPEASAVATSQRTEDIAGAGQANGVPGTASNLPRPISRPGTSTTGVMRRTENMNYQNSRTVRKIHLPQGGIKRLSVSVLLDHNVRIEGSGPNQRRIVEPPSPDRIKTTRDLISGVIGLQPDRGDQIVVESLPFESTLSYQPPRAPSASPAAPVATVIVLPSWIQDAIRKKDMVVLGALGGAVILLLAAVAFLSLLLIRKRQAKALARNAAAPILDPEALQALAGPSINEKLGHQMQAHIATRQQQEQEILSSLSLKLPSATTQKTEVLAKQLAEEFHKDADSLVKVVRTWISDMDY
jgi:flagellar M-ring protein FliF